MEKRALLPLVVVLIGCGVSACSSARPCMDDVVPFNQPADSAAVLHLDAAAGCVATTFDPRYGNDVRRGMVQDALNAWAAVPDSQLCFGAPTDSMVEPAGDGDRRIHFEAGAAGGGLPAVTNTSYDHSTGRIYGSTVVVDILNGADTGTPQLIRLIGLGIGLAAATPGADTVMAKPVTVSAPTAHDVTALLALYGGACKLY
jgi:hypothetical protein